MNIRIERKWLFGGAIGVLILLAIIAVLMSDSHGGSASYEPASDAEIAEAAQEVEDAEEEVLTECIVLWNAPENAGARSELNVLEPEYVSVTTSSLYSDKCLVTAANPALNLAQQFLEGGSNASDSTFSPTGGGEANSLPPNVTNWNALSDDYGDLRLESAMGDPEF